MPFARSIIATKDFPFCFCWANENWTRTWDGHTSEILLEQSHSSDADIRFFYDILPALKDPRYIKIDGKPLLLVYRVGELISPSDTAKLWRKLSIQEGLDGLHLSSVQSFDFEDPRDYGFDSSIQFPPLQTPVSNLATGNIVKVCEGFAGNIFNYQEVVDFYSQTPQRTYTLFRGVTPRWDNTARRMERGTSWIGSTPEAFGEWLKIAVSQTQRDHPSNEQFLFINAWNEWAEGAHLEPDLRHGYQYLEKTLAALQTAQGGHTGTPLDVTTSRHPDIFTLRQIWLERLFSASISSLPLAVQSLLARNFAAVSQLAFFGLQLSIEDGIAWCDLGSETIPITSSNALVRAHRIASNYQKSNPFVFVILQYGSPAVTSKCVQSILALDPSGCNIRIVVVDNFSSHDVAAETRRMFGCCEQVTILFNESNLGFAKGHNVGYLFARTELRANFIVAVNNDVYFEDSSFISKCHSLFYSTAYSVLGPDILVAGTRQENPWNDSVYSPSEWESLQLLYEDQYEAWQATGSASFARIGKASPQSRLTLNPILQGAAYIFSAIYIYDYERAFDESTFLYGEEFLLAVNCLLSGHPVVYSNSLSVCHAEGASTSTLDLRKKYSFGYNGAISSIQIARDRLARFSDSRKAISLDFNSPKISSLCVDGRKHVLFDLFFCQPGYHGGGEYGKAVFRALAESVVRNPGCQIWAALDPGLFIDDWVLEICRDYSVNLVSVTSFANISSLVDKGYFYAFYAPALVAYANYEYMRHAGTRLSFLGSQTKIIGTLHDIRDYQLIRDRTTISKTLSDIGWNRLPTSAASFLSEDAPSCFDLRVMYRAILNDVNVSMIVTVSRYCSSSVSSEFSIPQDRLSILYAAEKDRPTPTPFYPDNIGNDDEPFVLVLNASRPEKNAVSVAAAFDNLFMRNDLPDALLRTRVLFVGIKSISQLGLGNLQNSTKFSACPSASPGQLEFLYQQAHLLVYASFNEGFGYPPIEAMRYGTLSVVSNTTSLPEICGDAAIYCDPYSLASIEAAILKAYANPIPEDILVKHHATVLRRQRLDLTALVDLIIH